MRHTRHTIWPCERPGAWTGFWPECVGWRNCTAHTEDADPDYLCVHLIAKGRVRFRTERGVDVVLSPHALFTFWPGIPWRLTAEPPCRPTDVRMNWIRLRGPMRADFVRSLIGTPEDRPWKRAARPGTALKLMCQLERLARRYPPQADLTAMALLYQWASACSDHRSVRQAAQPQVRQIRDAMECYAESGMNVSDYAGMFGMSRSNLFLLFRKAYGTTPVKALSDIRLCRARTLLGTTDRPIHDISRVCGFRSPVQFSRHFRTRIGVSPRLFRQDQRCKAQG